MRDRVRSENLKVLIICPSESSLTIDQKALQDCLYLRDIGGNPTLYCKKDSYIEKEAQTFSLSRILHRGIGYNKFFSLSYFLDIRNVLKEEQWDIVHCYHLNSFWATAFWLFYKSKIPLFLTFNEFLSNKPKKVFYSLLLKRVDSVFVFTQSSGDRFISYFNLPKRKVKNIGLGVEVHSEKMNLSKSGIESIGTFINSELDFDNFRTLVFSLNTIEDFNYKLKVFTSKPVQDFYRFSELNTIVKTLEIENRIEFIVHENIDTAIESIDLCVNLSFNEPICDYEIKCLMRNIPLISPRTASRCELIKAYPGLLETYFFQDARELRNHIFKYLESFDIVKSKILSHRNGLLEDHGLDNYAHHVQGSYEWAVTSRLRLEGVKQKD